MGASKALWLWLPPSTSSLYDSVSKSEEEAAGFVSSWFYPYLCPSSKETYDSHKYYLILSVFLASSSFEIHDLLLKHPVSQHFLREFFSLSCSYWNLPLPWGSCCLKSYMRWLFYLIYIYTVPITEINWDILICNIRHILSIIPS